MRHLFIITLLTIALPFIRMNAQENVDSIANDMLQKQDLFEIQEKFPDLESKINVVEVKQLLGMLYCSATNRNNEAHLYIDSLLAHHQNELGFENITNIVLIKANMYAYEGKYKDAVDVAQDFLNQVSEFADTTKFEGFQQFLNVYRQLYHQPLPTLTRPERDVEVPYIRDIAGTRGGTLMRIPVQMNGKTYQFILDTGANASFLNARFARENGIKSIGIAPLQSMLGNVRAEFATVDSLVVGGIVFRNPVLYIGPEHPKLDSIYYIDAVLGADFLHRLVEMQIDNEKKIVRFPVHPSPVPATGPNMIYNDRYFRVKAYHNQKPMYFHLDTGDSNSSLNSFFYETNRAWVDSVAKTDSVGALVDNKIVYNTTKSLPNFDLTLGNLRVRLTDLFVNTKYDPLGDFPLRSGSLGQQFVLAFRRLTFNFKDGFLSGEPY